MELQGKIIAALPERSGTSARGDWKVQEFVLETLDAQYPRKMVFDVFGAERLQRFNIQVGQTVNVAFDIDAREYNGRWYNDIRAWNVVSAAQAAAQPVDPQTAAATMSAAPFPPADQPAAQPAQPSFEAAADDSSDLPF